MQDLKICARPKYLGYDGPMAKKTAKQLSAEENDALRALAGHILRERFDGHQGKFADALGVSQGLVSDFLARKKGAGMTLYRALERLTSSPSLASSIRKSLDDPFPTRRIVLELARGEGVAESVLLALMAHVPPIADDPGEDYWQETLLAIEERRRGLAEKLGPKATGTGTGRRR